MGSAVGLCHPAQQRANVFPRHAPILAFAPLKLFVEDGFAKALKCASRTDPVGLFDEQEVTGDCERVAAGVKIKSSLTINRINGEFSRTTLIGQSNTIYNGHCAVAKKLF
jgi:hypothetical protein